MAFNIHHPKFTMIAMVNLMIILFRNIFEKNFRKICLGLIAALWQCMGMRTRFSEHAENFGEEIFFSRSERVRKTLKCELYNHRTKSGILSEDLEYKNCQLDHMLTDTW